MDTILNDLLSCLDKSEKQYDKESIIKAYEFARVSHGTQMRVSGEAYIIHPVSVAMLLVELGMDNESLVASLLHDVVEDTGVTQEEVTQRFGRDVAVLVSGVTKLGKIPYSSREEQQAENIRKMLLAMSQDIRVIIIKLADRLHNMRTIDAMPAQKQRDKALETMEVYAPIAHRLGIRAFKEELEDLSLKHLDTVAYTE
ncbi:MAG: HD domain-containing protein, partial [Acetanaerobacterium sp.]